MRYIDHLISTEKALLVHDLRTKFTGLIDRAVTGHPISPAWGFDRGTPVDRIYIERFLLSNASDVRGHVLEIREDEYTRRFGGPAVTSSDVLSLSPNDGRPNIIGDLTDPPQIPSNTYDCIILTQTLQLIHDIRSALGTILRILRPGGVLDSRTAYVV